MATVRVWEVVIPWRGFRCFTLRAMPNSANPPTSIETL